VTGTAGCGKSYVLDAMRTLLGPRLAVAAYTGQAASLVGGVTIHSLLGLGLEEMSEPEAGGPAIGRLQERLRGVHYLAIDEYSMVSGAFLARMDRQLRAARPNSANLPFGGVEIILLGDPGQLDPVEIGGDYSLLRTRTPTNGQFNHLHGQSLYRSIEDVFELTTVRRADSTDPDAEAFARTLANLRMLRPDDQDYELLADRFRSVANNPANLPEWADATYLCATNADRVLANLDGLHAASRRFDDGRYWRIEAEQTGSAAHRGSEPEGGSRLERTLLLCRGSRVYLRTNIDVSVGLFNGACGTVVGVNFVNSTAGGVTTSVPHSIAVQWDNYTGDDSNGGCINILRVRRQFKLKVGGGGFGVRIQFPLSLAFSMTVHKAQGRTLDRAIVNLGRSEFARGLTFVALSRVARNRPSLQNDGQPPLGIMKSY